MANDPYGATERRRNNREMRAQLVWIRIWVGNTLYINIIIIIIIIIITTRNIIRYWQPVLVST